MAEDLASKMKTIVETWKSSGETLRAFANRTGVSYSKLIYWKVKIFPAEGKPRAKRKPLPTLVPVHITPMVNKTESVAASLEVIISNGLRLRVHPGFDAGETSRLIEILRSC